MHLDFKPTLGLYALEQVAQGGYGSPIPAEIQGQAGCGSGQPGLVVGNPAHSRGLKLNEHIMVLFNPGHSMILDDSLYEEIQVVPLIRMCRMF